MSKFTDAEFMSAAEKEAFIKAWERFIKSGLKRGNFNDRIYKHLSLHCGFIAHYNIHGFYAERFENPEGRRRTFEQLLDAGRTNIMAGDMPEYRDVNTAMREIIRAHADKLNSSADADELAELEAVQSQVSARISQLKGGR